MHVEDAGAAVVPDFIGRRPRHTVNDEALCVVALGVGRTVVGRQIRRARCGGDAEIAPAWHRDTRLGARLTIGIIVVAETERGHRLAAALPLRGALGEGAREEDFLLPILWRLGCIAS